MKASEFLSIFASRTDRAGVTEYGKPQSRKAADGQVEKLVELHFEGIQRCGLYNLLNGDVVRWGLLDFDSHERKDEGYLSMMDGASAVSCDVLNEFDVHAYRELSKSGRGNYHIWIPFSSPIPAAYVRRVLREFVEFIRKDLSLPVLEVEIFPKQDTAQGGPGNFVWLPLYPPDMNAGRTIFIDKHGNRIEPDFRPSLPEALKRLVSELPLPDESKPPQAPSTGGEWGELLRGEGVVRGNRHNTLTRIVGHLKHRIPCEESLALLKNWNDSLKEPLPQAEFETTVRSLYRDVRAKQAFKIMCGKEMIDMNIPPQQDLLKGLIRAKSLNFLAGEESSGKSILSMNLGLSIATGAKSILAWEIERRGKILFLNNELYVEDFVLRFRKMAERRPGLDSLDNFLAPDSFPSLRESSEAIHQACAEFSPVLIIVDCLYYAHNEDENDSSSMKDLLRRLQALRDECSTAILVVHHLRKGGREQRLNNELMRGAGVFGAAADSVLMMRRSQTDESKRIIKPTKLRHSGDAHREPRLLSLDNEFLWFRDEGVTREEDHFEERGTTADMIRWEEILPEGKEMRFHEIINACEGLKCSPKTIQRALDEAMTRGEVEKPRHGWYRIGQKDKPL